MSSVKQRRCAFVFLLAMIGAVMFMLNAHTPLMMDDYDYSFSWHSGERLGGVMDILASQAAHYGIWGGRSVVHFFAQMFLYLGKPVFNVFNTLMYLLLLLEIYALSRGKETEWDWRLLLAAHLVLFSLTPFFGVVFLWLDGACNYLWGTVLALVPLLIAKSERTGGFFDAGFSRGVWALPLSFFAGWTNENTACGVLAAMFFLLVWDRFRGRKVRVWRLAAIAMQALGTAVLLLAPGNFARAGSGAERSMVMELVYRMAVVTYCALRYAGIPAALALLLCAAAKKRGTLRRFEWFCVLSGAAFLSAYALVGSPQISDRSFTAVLVLAVSAMLTAFGDFAGQVRRSDLISGTVLTLLVLLGSCAAFADVKAHESAWLAQVERIESAAADAETCVQIASVPSASRYTMSITIEKDASAWPNSTLSKYYGIDVCGE